MRGRLGLVHDARGKPSWTLTLAIPALILLTTRFVLGGGDVTVGPIRVVVTAWSGADYALAAGVWLGLFAQREWLEKRPGAS